MQKTSPEILNGSRGIQIPYPLIINADDLGLNTSTNAAIAYTFSKGYINSTSLIVNMDGFEDGLHIADKYNFRDRVGIHFNLTEGFPLTDLSGTGLIDAEGKFLKRAVHRPMIFFSPRIRRKIKAEINQQFKKAIESGVNPTHINSHHHVHTLPWISDLFIELAKKHKLKIRIAQTKKGKNFFKNAYREWLNRQYKKKNINFSDEFENAVCLLNYLEEIKDTKLVFEIMVHPVYQQDKIVDNYSQRSFEELVEPINTFFRQKVPTTLLAALPYTALL